MMFILLQLFLRKSESAFTDQRGNRNLDPLLTGTLMIGAVAVRWPIALTQGTCDALSRAQFCFAETCPALVRRIPQDAPHRRSLPTRRRCPRGNLPIVQSSCDRVDAQSLLRVGIEHHAHDFGLGFVDFEISVGVIALLDVSITIRCSAQNIHESLLSPVPFAPPSPLHNLGALILRNHA